jgi:hypothetical protein
MLNKRLPGYGEVLTRLKDERDYLDKSAEDGPKSFFKRRHFGPLADLERPFANDGVQAWIVTCRARRPYSAGTLQLIVQCSPIGR